MDIGIKIAIDDFGVEYSNISILEKFNFDIIKFDKYFDDSIEESVVGKTIIRFLNYLSIKKRVL